MKKIIFCALFFGMVALSKADGVDYSNILYSGTGSAAGLPLVRYLAWSEDLCIVVQSLKPGGRGAISVQKKICSLDGNSFYDDYAAIDFKKGFFEDDKLFFELGFSPLRGIGEKIMTCEVVFNDGVADHLFCEEKDEAAEKCKCSCDALDLTAIKRHKTNKGAHVDLTKMAQPHGDTQSLIGLKPSINENRRFPIDGASALFEPRRN